MLELAGNASKDLKVGALGFFLYPFMLLACAATSTACHVLLQVKRITPRHLQLAIRGDEELDSLIKVNPLWQTASCLGLPVSWPGSLCK